MEHFLFEVLNAFPFRSLLDSLWWSVWAWACRQLLLHPHLLLECRLVHLLIKLVVPVDSLTLKGVCPLQVVAWLGRRIGWFPLSLGRTVGPSPSYLVFDCPPVQVVITSIKDVLKLVLDYCVLLLELIPCRVFEFEFGIADLLWILNGFRIVGRCLIWVHYVIILTFHLEASVLILPGRIIWRINWLFVKFCDGSFISFHLEGVGFLFSFGFFLFLHLHFHCFLLFLPFKFFFFLLLL